MPGCNSPSPQPGPGLLAQRQQAESLPPCYVASFCLPGPTSLSLPPKPSSGIRGGLKVRNRVPRGSFILCPKLGHRMINVASLGSGKVIFCIRIL